MASRVNSEANLKTAGLTPYTLMEGYPTLEVSDDGVSGVEQVLLAATDLESFLAESFPVPVVRNGLLFLPSRRRMPGSDILITKKISVKPHTGEKPADPFGVNGNLPEDTFDKELLLTINYETMRDSDSDSNNERDPTNPLTFLEREISLGGEFITIGPQNTETGDSEVGNDSSPEPEDGEHTWQNAIAQDRSQAVTASFTPAAAEPANVTATQDPNLPIVKMVPTGELKFKWPLAIRPPWRSMFRYLGACNGRTRTSSGTESSRVQNVHNALFWNLEPETILYSGFSATQEFVWNGSSASAQPWNVDFQFSVKRVEESGSVYGWNHIWVPKEQKWKKLYRRRPGGGRIELYKQRNLLHLFLGGTDDDRTASG